jgi:pilus assembly protein Flp/PilA
MRSLVARIWQDQSGTTAIEYGLIAALLAVAIVAALQTVAADLISIFLNVATELA